MVEKPFYVKKIEKLEKLNRLCKKIKHAVMLLTTIDLNQVF